MRAGIQGRLDASGLRAALAVSRFNEIVTDKLLDGARDCLLRHGADEASITVVRVPGSWELPPVVRRLTESGRFDAVIALGALIRGETPHFDVLAAAVTQRLAEIAMRASVPVAYGVLTTDTVAQAIDRAGAKAGNKGWEVAQSAIEMADVYRQLGSLVPNPG